MTREVKIAAAQLGPAAGTKGETVERMMALISEAARAQVEFLCFPELALTPYFCTKVRESVEEYFETQMPSPLTEPLFRAAQGAGVAFVLPYAEKEDSEYYNSAVVVGSDGQVLGKFRKVHIPGTVEPTREGLNILEKRYFSYGNLGFPVFDTAKVKVGVQVCYDRRFPESFRSLGLNGAEIICSPYNTPAFGRPVEEGRSASDLCIKAAAYFNGCFAMGIGKAGVENGEQFIGGSLIVSPSGDVIARADSDSDELVTATIDLDQVTQARQRMDLDTNRRPSEYARLTQKVGS